MSLSSVTRIIDANLNRLAEGLRILEDVARMVLDDSDLTQRLKTLRHDLIRGDISFNLELLQSRNSTEDVGATLEVPGESQAKGLPLIVVANSRRAQEALRVLEEVAKLPEYSFKLNSNQFKNARFELYTIEQKLVAKLTRRDKSKKVSGLYVIIDTQALQGRDPIAAARQVIEAGVKVIQLRAKSYNKGNLIQLAGELQILCTQNDVLFIINDYLDVALAIGADGLHVGQDDLPVEVARRLLPLDKILGCSACTSEQVLAAEASGADYVAVGSIFPTASKADIDVVGIDRLRRIKQAARTPIVAIGGINKTNVYEVIAAGADSACIISAVLLAPDIARAARDLIEIIEVKK